MQEIKAYERRNGVEETVLMESLPRSSSTDAERQAEGTAHLYAALSGGVVIGIAPLKPATVDETKPTVVTIPEGMHAKLAECFGGPVSPVGEDLHTKLARAFTL